MLGYSVQVGAAGALQGAVVVIAVDDSATREQIAEGLRGHGVRVVAAPTAQRAIDAVRARPVDLVGLDVDMPGLSGVDACRVVKTITKDRFVPVVLLTPADDPSARVRGLRAGADDHVSKPLEEHELLKRVETMLRVKRTHEDVQFAKKELQYDPQHDELRSLPDRRHFHDRLESEFGEAQRHLDPLACGVIAVEELRRIVTDHGAPFAARILEEVAGRLRRIIRPTDIAARFRTAEFGLLLPNTRPARALMLADQIVSDVALRPISHDGQSVGVSVSIGIGLYPSGSIRSHSELLDAASIAVARARVAGSNRVCVVQQQGYIFRPTLPGAA